MSRTFLALVLVGCASAPSLPAAPADATTGRDTPSYDAPDGSSDALSRDDVPPALDASPGDALVDASGDEAAPDATVSTRTRLLTGYLAALRAQPDVTQSNGLRGRDLPDVCALWNGLTPSGRAVFLTITARLDGSRLADGSSMLSHITALRRVAGGEGATVTSPGSCGGAEFNRVVLSMDVALHRALVAANDNGDTRALSDVIATSWWRASRDLGGPHAPFTLSDETEGGAPRGQVHFFRDTTTAPATAPLGRRDLAAVVDPLALEMDQDYDCAHASNPLCAYIFYGTACLPMTSRPGVDIYGMRYGAVDLAWRPDGCGP